MFSWLKKHFIPHEGNDHRPHLLRGSGLRNIAVAVIFVEVIFFLLPVLTRINTTGNIAAVLPAILADLTNNERATQNLPALTVSPLLNEAAQMKADDMAAKGYFAHTSPEGKTPWYWLLQVGYNYQYAGENLAINFSDSKDVTAAWMASPTHKENIEKGNYTEVGTGVATGMYEGHETVFVAQVYANPLPPVATAEQATPVKNVAPVKTAPTKVAVVKESSSTPAVLGVETPVQTPTFLESLMASPRSTTNVILYVIFGIVTLALLLYIFIKIRNHHTDLLTNGLIALAVIGAIITANNYWSHKNMVTSYPLDYSYASKI
jgi:hypothetical protein